MAMAEGILNYEKDPKEDYYGILGCDKSSSVGQISAEFKVRAKHLHPDKSDDPACEEKFKLLQTVSALRTEAIDSLQWALHYNKVRGMNDTVLECI